MLASPHRHAPIIPTDGERCVLCGRKYNDYVYHLRPEECMRLVGEEA
jgi:hypothetical protein